MAPPFPPHAAGATVSDFHSGLWPELRPTGPAGQRVLRDFRCKARALAGFLVDRMGARPVLLAALGCFVAASLAALNAQGYAGLMLASALAGLGNAPFHPADFTILNKRVSLPPAGTRVFRTRHQRQSGLGGCVPFPAGHHRADRPLGAGPMPPLVLTGVLLVLVWRRQAGDDHHTTTSPMRKRTPSPARRAPTGLSPAAPPLWLCFHFSSGPIGLAAIQSLPALPAAAVWPAGLHHGVCGHGLCCLAPLAWWWVAFWSAAPSGWGIIAAAMSLAAALCC